MLNRGGPGYDGDAVDYLPSHEEAAVDVDNFTMYVARHAAAKECNHRCDLARLAMPFQRSVSQQLVALLL